ncbi:DNA (cytosine-5-)-methyltransferase [uncultured Muribaculum sp.]|uniref:DNA (cytosine-5-)-methyltransferase n=1 Tax=uncultured Muribaculum sp. TaxID=1918613 RepID=UPI00321FECFB
MKQMSFFDGTQKFRNDKPIRLIELFAGYGSQALALKYLGVQFEHYRISEWATKSIQAYKDLHATDDRTDYSQGLTLAKIKAWLTGKISTDYSTPATAEQIGRFSEKTARTLYNNMRATRNIGSITQATADDLAIVNTAEFLYIMTYSFPCQDLSAAGNGAGMSKGSGTRSGLLWEVERLLNEIARGGGYDLPQVLLMENVPQVIGGGAIADFVQWREFLEGLGYKNYTQLMNAKGYGIPQNRNRCFMVSILGDYDYIFPPELPLQYRLKDFIERRVDEKYYISDEAAEKLKEQITIAESTTVYATRKRIDKIDTEVAKTLCARDYKGFGTGFDTMNAVVEVKCEQVGMLSGGKWDKLHDISRRVYGIDGLSPTVHTAGGGQQELKIAEPTAYDEQNGYLRKDGTVGTLTTDGNSPKHNNRVVELNYRIRKLTERECFRLMGVKSEDFERIAKKQSMSSLYHLAGDSIVTACLMAIFGLLLEVDYKQKITELTEELKEK